MKNSVLHCGMIRTRVGWGEIRYKKRGNVVIRGFAATDCNENPSKLTTDLSSDHFFILTYWLAVVAILNGNDSEE